MKRIVSAVTLFLFVAQMYAADEITVKIEPYTKDEFPQWARDIRRTEIITFGSLPFVTMTVSLGYSVFRYFDHGMDNAYSPNPFAKSGNSLSKDEQIGIIVTSAGISVLLGLTDLTINLIKRQNAKKRAKRSVPTTITITEELPLPVTPPPGEGAGTP